MPKSERTQEEFKIEVGKYVLFWIQLMNIMKYLSRELTFSTSAFEDAHKGS